MSRVELGCRVNQLSTATSSLLFLKVSPEFNFFFYDAHISNLNVYQVSFSNIISEQNFSFEDCLNDSWKLEPI
jgi:hypothetical protein